MQSKHFRPFQYWAMASLALVVGISGENTWPYADLPPEYFADQMIEAHNKVRADMRLPPLTYDMNIAKRAQDYAETRRRDCEPKNSPKSEYGENVFARKGWKWAGPHALEAWVDDEKDNYDVVNNVCLNGKRCEDYLQVVWRNTTRYGCARINCERGDLKTFGIFMICNYSPPMGKIPAERPF